MNKVGYIPFGRDDFSYGMQLVLSKIDGHEIYRVSPKTARHVDWLLIGVNWWEATYLMADFFRKAGISKVNADGPRIVAGGYSSFNPVPLSQYAHYVICGDGEAALPALLRGESHPSVFEEGQKSAEWGTEPISPFSYEIKGSTRIEIARGCKYRCKFCSIAHLKPYRELSIDDFARQARMVRTGRVGAFAPEPAMHSHDDTISAICRRLGLARIDADVRIENIDRRVKPANGIVRTGMEGLSYKLRRSVGKNRLTDDYIIGQMEKAIGAGIKAIHMFFIVDLPGERHSDYFEAETLFDRIDTIEGIGGFFINLSGSAFTPMPHTPMQWCGIHLDRGSRWGGFLYQKTGIRTGMATRYLQKNIILPQRRILQMLAIRGGDDFSEIEHALSANGIIKIRGNSVQCEDQDALVKALESYGGHERWTGEIDPSMAPWSVLKTPVPIGSYSIPE